MTMTTTMTLSQSPPAAVVQEMSPNDLAELHFDNDFQGQISMWP